MLASWPGARPWILTPLPHFCHWVVIDEDHQKKRECFTGQTLFTLKETNTTLKIMESQHPISRTM